jgi:paraquat-inducible protein A
MLTRATLDRRTVWRALAPETTAQGEGRMVACATCDLVQPASHVGTACPRCGAMLHLRKPKSLERTTALLVAAFVLIFPANIYPMNISHRLGRHVTYTIFHGVHALFTHGLWALGVVIFFTSIVIPVVKIAALTWCVWSVRSHSSRHLILKTRLHRLINELGRWSCVDPFTIVLFVPLMNFGALASSSAGWGSTAFIAVVVLTMIATRCFDSRLLWDAAGGRIG